MTILKLIILGISWFFAGCIAYWIGSKVDTADSDYFVFCIWLGYVALALSLLALIGSAIKSWIDRL